MSYHKSEIKRLVSIDSAPDFPHVDSWKARWIWCSQGTDGQHDFVNFRKDFRIDSEREKAYLHVTAEREYELWINGAFVGRGPALSDPRFKRYDTYDVASYLNQGDNCIAALVYHDCSKSRMTAHAEAHGFLCQLDLGDMSIVSDETWAAKVNYSWRDIFIAYDDSTWAEFYDGRGETVGWKEADFDDSNWSKAVALIKEKNSLWGSLQPQARFFPWINLIPSETSALDYTTILPVSIHSHGEVLQQRESSAPDTAVRMSLEEIRDCEKTSIENLESLICENDSPVIITNSSLTEPDSTFDGLRNVTIVLDFGRLMNARFGLSLDSNAGAIVDIGYSYLLDNGRVVPYVSNRTVMANQYIAREGKQEWQTFQWHHFRYVQLTFRELTKPLKLLKVWAQQVEHPFDRRGEFVCDDSIVNQSFEASRLSAELCTVDRTMDSSSRERRQYLGDCSGMLPAIWSCFGDASVIRKYFAQIDEGQHSTGQYRYCYPGYDDDKASLFDHSLGLPLRLYEHYMLYDDPELLDRMWPGLLRFNRLCESVLNSNGLVEAPPYSIWLDWADIDRDGISFVLNAMLSESLRRSSVLAQRLGHEQNSENWKRQAKTIKDLLRKNFFDKQSGLFVDSISEGGLSKKTSEHTISLAVLFDIATSEQIESMMEAYQKNSDQFGQASPIWMYMPNALIHAGRTDLAIQWIHRHFEPIFEFGLQTAPETWCLFGEKTIGSWRTRNSRAVAQGAGFVPFALLSELCGIQPFEPGFRSVRFAPQPGPLLTFQGTFPGPDGDYSLSFTRKSDTCEIELKVPEERQIVLDIPFVETEASIFVDKKPISPNKLITMPNGKTVPRIFLRGKSEYKIISIE